MAIDREEMPTPLADGCLAKDVKWRRIAKAYVCLHAIVALCTCFFGLEYLLHDWYKLVPRFLGAAIHGTAMFGSCVFFFSSPIAAAKMISRLSRGREWLYLGLCDIALFVLQLISMGMGSL